MILLEHYDGISLAMIILCSIFSGIVTVLILDPARGGMMERGIEFAGLVRKRQEAAVSYHRLSAWLRKNGASYHFGKRMSPYGFVTVSTFLFMAGMTAGMSVSPVAALMLGAFCATVLPLSIPAFNRADNRDMLPDLRLIYHSLGVQIKSGVYVTDALAECQASVRHKRLKDALSVFYADVIMKSDIYASLEKFRSSFDDRYIDSLCITVVQALESGKAVELLNDIAEQVKDMENAVFESKRASLDRVLTFSQLFLLGSVMVTALYICIVYMMNKAVYF